MLPDGEGTDVPCGSSHLKGRETKVVKARLALVDSRPTHPIPIGRRPGATLEGEPIPERFT